MIFYCQSCGEQQLQAPTSAAIALTRCKCGSASFATWKPPFLATQPAPSQTGTPRADHFRREFKHAKESSVLIDWILDELAQEETRRATAELALSQAKRDAERLLRAAQEIRLDFANHAPEEQAKWIHLPEFRAAIDAALAKRKGEGEK